MRVFVAHSSRDARRVTSALDACRNGTAPRWRRIEQIERRADWEEIAKGLILEADAFLFVTTPRSVRSEPCLWELTTARETGLPCWQWVLHRVPESRLPVEVKTLPVLAVGAQVDTAAWFC